MYANGLSNVGSLITSTFLDLINKFPDTENIKIYWDKRIKQDVFEQLVQPFLHLYQPKMHECTMNIVIAKTIEMFAGAQYQKLDQIHKHIAKEMNLTANHRGL